MATDEERLLVRIEANQRQFERALAQITSGADRAAGRVERRFRSMERSLSGIGAGIGRSLLAPLAAFASAREIGQAADAFTRIQNQLRIAGLEGEEMARVFEHLFDSAQKNAAPVESLVELYGRASLVQKELNVSSEELLRFTDGVAAALRVSGKSAQESSGALLQLAQALGSGTVRAEEFNSILEGALPIAQAAARGLEEAGGSVAKLRQLVIDGKVSSEAFFRAFEAGQGQLEALAETTQITLAGALTRLNNSFISVVGGMNETTGTTRVLVGAMDGLGDTIEEIGAAIDFLVGKWDDLNKTVDPALLERFRRLAFDLDLGLSAINESKEEVKEGEPIQKGDLIAGPEITSEAENVANRISQAFEAAKTVSLKDFAPPVGTKAKKEPKTPEQKFGDDLTRIRERTEALRVEAEIIDLNTFAQERARAITDLLNEARRAGLEITPKLRAEIESEANAYATAAANLENTEERFRAINDLAQEFGSIAIDAFEGLLDGTKSLNESLGDAVKMLRRMVLEALLLGQGPLASLFGTSRGGSGGIGGLLSGLLGGLRGGGSSGGGGGIGHQSTLAALPTMATTRSGSMSFNINVSGARGNSEIMDMVRAGVSQGLTAYGSGEESRTQGYVTSMATSGRFGQIGLSVPGRRAG